VREVIFVNKRELKAFKEKLVHQRETILRGIPPKMEASPPTGEPEGGDVCDIASSDRETELRLRLSEREREKLREIEEALERVDDGSFGICDKCGEKIPLGRLKAMPFTTVCVKCKSEEERRLKLQRSAAENILYRDIIVPDLTKEEE
jgi:DnaK suppressor protein